MSRTRLDAIHLTQALRHRLVDFSCQDHYVRDGQLSEQLRELWAGSSQAGGLLGELWVEASMPARTSPDTLATLTERGVFSKWLMEQIDHEIPRNRALYTHQSESVLAIGPEVQPRPALIVSSGTGSGKTEAFLLPLLNVLVQKKRREGGGCRALVLYPINALVNDQVERLAVWLRGQEQLRFCHFTGETPENYRKWTRTTPNPTVDPSRCYTRQHARGLEDQQGRRCSPRLPVPDIIVTNYSMLEYMLCRPQDQVFFGPDLQVVVLDEAHLYTGTLAAEMALLLRRLYDRCGLAPHEVTQLATSATIGSREQSDLLQNFASQLFSRQPEQVTVIFGQEAPPGHQGVTPEPPDSTCTPECIANLEMPPTLAYDANGVEEFIADPVAVTEACATLQKITSPRVVQSAAEASDGTVTRLLWEGLRFAPLTRQLVEFLTTRVGRRQVAMPDLAEELFSRRDPIAQAACAQLLNWCAAARPGLEDTPMLAHRMHLVTRAPDGVQVCLNNACPGPSRWGELGALQTGHHDSCAWCAHRTADVLRCRQCGEAFLGGAEERGRLRPAGPSWLRPREFRHKIYHPNPQGARFLDSSGRVTGVGGEGFPVSTVERSCPNCDSLAEDEVQAFEVLGALPLSLVAETLLAEVPPLSTKIPAVRDILPAAGRRLLAFSDSRAEAAKLGPRLRRQHEFQIVRAALYGLLQGAQSDEDISVLENEVAELVKSLAETDPNSAEGRRLQRNLERTRQDLAEARAGGRLEEWGHKLAQEPLLAQLLDDTGAGRHRLGEYNQATWKANAQAVAARAQMLLAREVARPIRRGGVLTLEGCGIVEVSYPGLEDLSPPAEFMGLLPTAAGREQLTQDWPDLLAGLLDTLRLDGCVTLDDDDEDSLWQSEARLVDHWSARDRFVGAEDRQRPSRRRRFVKAILARLGVEADDETITGLLQAVFDSLAERAVASSPTGHRPTAVPPLLGWIEKEQKVRLDQPSQLALRLVGRELGIRRPPRLFQCTRTLTVWPRSVQGCAPDLGSDGTLEPVTPEELDASPRVGRLRRELATSPIYHLGLWAEEHSAQLSAGEGRRLQELFKAGMRNLLSATTTLELGIDIGGLSGTFLTNVPPAKANYLQRAGRVGRRADGSSVVVTYARPQPFDREVFRRTGDYLARPFRAPRVLMERERIAVRHLHAWLMGSFFQQLYDPSTHLGAMNAFGYMGAFLGQPLPQWWDGPHKPAPAPLEPLDAQFTPFLPEWLGGELPGDLRLPFVTWLEHVRSRRRDYGARLERLMANTPVDPARDWDALFERARQSFDSRCDEWLSDYQQLFASWESAQEARQANAIQYNLRTLYNLTVIESFSDGGFLPRYGFPVGLHKLKVVVPDEKREGKVREEDQYRLERAGVLALREYVPGSQILVGGRRVTSQGLLKHWSAGQADESFGLSGQMANCVKGHRFYWIGDAPEGCSFCGESIRPESISSLLFPRYGFTTAAWDPPRISTEVDRVGTVETSTVAFSSAEKHSPRTVESFGGLVGCRAFYREQGRLLVYNRGEKSLGFAICTKCGYAKSEEKQRQEGRQGLPSGFASHAPLHSVPKKGKRIFCWAADTAPVLRHRNLAAQQPTDIVLVDFSGLKGYRSELAQTLAVALQQAGARLLSLDSRELGCLEVPVGGQTGPVVYDNSPGGAGHVLELFENGQAWLEEACRLLRGSEEHDQRCQTACLDCLLTFDVQVHVREGRLNRPAALAFLEAVISHG